MIMQVPVFAAELSFLICSANEITLRYPWQPVNSQTSSIRLGLINGQRWQWHQLAAVSCVTNPTYPNMTQTWVHRNAAQLRYILFSAHKTWSKSLLSVVNCIPPKTQKSRISCLLLTAKNDEFGESSSSQIEWFSFLSLLFYEKHAAV